MSAHLPLDWLIDALSKCFVSCTLEHWIAFWSLYRFFTGQVSLTYVACRYAGTAAHSLDGICLGTRPIFYSFCFVHAFLLLSTASSFLSFSSSSSLLSSPPLLPPLPASPSLSWSLPASPLPHPPPDPIS